MTHTTTYSPSTSTEAAPAQHPATRALGRMTDGSESKRAAYDFYPTPPEATRALLAVERFSRPLKNPPGGS